MTITISSPINMSPCTDCGAKRHAQRNQYLPTQNPPFFMAIGGHSQRLLGVSEVRGEAFSIKAPLLFQL